MRPTSSTSFLLLLALATSAAIPGGSWAGAVEATRRGPNADPEPKLDAADSAALSAVERLALSDRLAAYGDRAGDPVALVQAAKIRKGVDSTLLQRAASGNTFEALLAGAEKLAPGNTTIAALIADARAYRSRDLPLVSAGLAALRKAIGGRGADRADLTFRGAEPAVVYVRSDAGADLDLYVYDEFNNLICSDESSGHEAVCRWRPRWTGSFLVDVRNLADQHAEYVLTANYVEPSAQR